MIANERELRDLMEHARRGESVALDTEFIWERTYYPQLGLIQLALADETCHLIDPLAIDDLSALGALLADRAVVKILHDAPQDLAILGRVTKAVPTNIFDTRVAAGFSGLSSTISLADLIGVLLDIDLEKTQTRTNWLKRPLDQRQIDYALDDVRYLGAVRILLLSRIVVPEIKQWLRAELDHLCRPQSYVGIEEHMRFRRVKGAGSLGRAQLAVLRELAAWREQEARQSDRPRGHVLNDSVLLALARDGFTTRDDLERANLLSSKKLKRYQQTILDCIRRAQSAGPGGYPEIERPLRLSGKAKTVYDRLVGFIQLKCDMQGIDPQLIGTASELKQLAKNLNNPGSPLPPRLTEGWRKTFLEEFFRQRA